MDLRPEKFRQIFVSLQENSPKVQNSQPKNLSNVWWNSAGTGSRQSRVNEKNSIFLASHSVRKVKFHILLFTPPGSARVHLTFDIFLGGYLRTF